MTDNIENQATEQQEQPENDFLQGREGEATALAATLKKEDEDNDFIPKPEPTEQPTVTAENMVPSDSNTDAMSPDMAGGVAFMAIESYESIIRTMVGTEFTLPPEMKKEAIEKYGPLIVKYGPAAMGTFGQYQNELVAALFTATLVRESFSQVRSIKAEKAANDKPEQLTETTDDAVKEEAA
ncbi:hypothetical protein [Pseudoalteromonas aurantia]|uniref:Uncharacterized protein n=1 Tax=Pseudoalteromonas aurantia TaxID=43654 RepID=A0A5S3V263_9GAMM|nr:hypothetical protein [Pseudoalteromonas aurantia]TMO64433.1 hypothetical protein CWC19_18350 [Pseudoalteromonas aurantia]